MRSKFLGTASYLVWNGKFERTGVKYIILIETRQPQNKALLGPFMQKMKHLMNCPESFKIKTFVMYLETWNATFPQFKARKLQI